MELHAIDFVVFSLILLISFSIGVYYAYRSKGNTSEEEYFVAGRNMNVFAASCSAFASAFAGFGVFVMPNDVYFRGPGLWYAAFIANTIESVLLVLVFVPIYHRLRLTNIYDYLELRFNSAVKYVAEVTQVMYTLFFMGVTIYSPSLVLALTFGININVSILVIGGVCLIYTAIGGMRAVVWSDAFQTLVIVGGTIAIFALAIPSGGGVGNVFRTAYEGGRDVSVDTSLDVTVPYTLLSSIVTIPLNQLGRSAVGQYNVQRYLVVRTLNEARITAVVGQFLGVFCVCLYIFVGLVMYTYYAGCDPFTSGMIQRKDQMFPLFLSDVFQNYNGAVGLIIAVVVSGILSTVSSGINALAAMTYKEFSKVILKDPTPAQKMHFTKALTAVIGLVILGAALLGRFIGSIIATIQIWLGIFVGPILATFFLGMFFRRANSIGALVGMITGVCCGIWIKIGSFFYPLPQTDLPLSTDQCNVTDLTYLANMTEPTTTVSSEDPVIPFSIYHISSTYYSLATCITTWTVAIIVSLATKPQDAATLNEDLFVHPRSLFSNFGKPSADDESKDAVAEEKI